MGLQLTFAHASPLKPLQIARTATALPYVVASSFVFAPSWTT